MLQFLVFVYSFVVACVDYLYSFYGDKIVSSWTHIILKCRGRLAIVNDVEFLYKFKLRKVFPIDISLYAVCS